MGTFITTLRRAPKRAAAAVAILAAVVVVPATMFAWGPERPTYTIEHPADHVTFNSITNNPDIGDERNFVGIREAGTTTTWTDNMTVQAGKSYSVRMYVHNNAAANLNKIAENVTAKFNLPTTTGKSIDVSGFLSSSNATPTEIYDHATFKSDKDFNLAYQKDTLKFENNSFGANGTKLPESIFTSAGAKLGYDKLDGKIPGCFQYDGYVTFTVKPQFGGNPNFTVEKQVSKKGENKWTKNYTAQPGETVDYLVSYKNTGDAQQDNVTMKDTLPTGMTYAAGSSTLGNSINPNGIKTNDTITTEGLNVGSYKAGGNAWVIFSAKVPTEDKLACGDNKLHNVARVTSVGAYKEDSADVTVKKTCQPGKIQVCDTTSGKVIAINENEFDSTKHNKDLTKCDKCDVPGKEDMPKDSPDCKSTSVEELPQTGLGSTLAAFTGVGALTAGTSYYLRSIRARQSK